MVDYFATKYDSAKCEVIANLASDYEGFGHAWMGETDAPSGYVQLVRLDASCDLSWSGLGEVGDLALEHGVTATDVYGWHIVTENSQGFVSVQTYPLTDEGKADFDMHVNAINDSLDEWYTQDDD